MAIALRFKVRLYCPFEHPASKSSGQILILRVCQVPEHPAGCATRTFVAVETRARVFVLQAAAHVVSSFVRSDMIYSVGVLAFCKWQQEQ